MICDSQSHISQIGCPCKAHVNCPKGKYTKTAGSVISEPVCEDCQKGLFKAEVSASSVQTDTCTAHLNCPAGQQPKSSGSATAQPECELCAPGYFKVYRSNDKCAPHHRCAAGKYTKKSGNAIAQPMCETCPGGMYKDAKDFGSLCREHDPGRSERLWTMLNDVVHV